MSTEPIPDPLETLERGLEEETGKALASGGPVEYTQGVVAGLQIALDLVRGQQRLMDEIAAEYRERNGPGVAWGPG